MRVNARFPGSPENIKFSFLPPKGIAAIHDPGAFTAETKIQRDGDDLYYYIIDTRQMRGGLGWWYFVSEDPDPSKRRAKVGRFVVRDVPTSLYANELVMLGSDVPAPSSRALWPWIATSAVAGTLLGALITRHGSSSVAEEVAADAVDTGTEAVASGALRPRGSDGKFLGAAIDVSPADGEAVEAAEDVEDASEGMSGGSVALIAISVAALTALGYWLWRKHRAKSAQSLVGEEDTLSLPAHEEPVVCDGLDLLGAQDY